VLTPEKSLLTCLLMLVLNTLSLDILKEESILQKRMRPLIRRFSKLLSMALPIICCGESLTQREQGITIDWIRQQIKIAFLGVTAEQAKTAVIAYEPIWAIGTGKTATTEQAQEVCAAIRVCIGEIYDEATAEAIRIQYGGSVNAATAPELFVQPDIDGGLVGGAALKPDFGKIVNWK